jgi:hypothetical protein
MGIGRKWVDRSIERLLGLTAPSIVFKTQAKQAKAEAAEKAKIAKDPRLPSNRAVNKKPSGKMEENLAKNNPIGKMEKYLAKKKPSGQMDKKLAEKKPSGDELAQDTARTARSCSDCGATGKSLLSRQWTANYATHLCSECMDGVSSDDNAIWQTMKQMGAVSKSSSDAA